MMVDAAPLFLNLLILLPLLISAIAEDTYYEYIFSSEEDDIPTTPPPPHTTLSARNQIPSVSTSQYNVLATADQKIVFQNKTTTETERWEWVTDLSGAWGGVIDAPITSLAYSPSSELLYIGTTEVLNFWDEKTSRFSRIGGNEGLPMRNITSLTVDDEKGFVYIGTTEGLILYRPSNKQHTWRYFAGPRYLPDDYIVGLSLNPTGSLDILHESQTTTLKPTKFTLSKKQAHFTNMLNERHRRTNLVSDFPNHDSDNDGLWTSLVLVSSLLEASLTSSAAASDSASYFLRGLTLLNEVPNSPGFFARSVCAPEEWGVTCGNQDAGGDWNVSTHPDYQNWFYKSDTSSDEAVGQIFGLLMSYKLSDVPEDKKTAKKLLTTIVNNLIDNDLNLIDPLTRQPTLWGRWGPEEVNNNRQWSDTRGLQSLQIVSFLAAAAAVTDPTHPDQQKYSTEFNRLAQEEGYLQNLLNTKITTPIDLNYSDDELTFLPYLTFFIALEMLEENKTGTTITIATAPITSSLERTFQFVRPEQSSLWNSIFLACTSILPSPLSDKDRNQIINDIIYNLETWPLSHIDYETRNENRIDFNWENSSSRFGETHSESSKKIAPFPANERRQFRWNASPYAITDGGSNSVETDPGAFLLPYWLSKYYGLF
ncbi:hypothetical protein TrVE_jg1208 [Triparma verrucosa]|uniref:Uncharacterized protein n=1 Tax=Triparma verrucosa TaxID=1606542 RepID=A0A9W7C2S1_9STRA|nr:hypothetical protein TrVE_jg1208 [Triparma verrucosa]